MQVKLNHSTTDQEVLDLKLDQKILQEDKSTLNADSRPASATQVVQPIASSTVSEAPKMDAVDFSENPTQVKLKKSAKLAGKKQIPTILGLLILFVALISGVLLFGQGTGVFAPRATPQTTPKNIRLSNLTDKSFTVSFYTDESTVAFIKYGEEAKTLNKQASDDRDQLSGIVKDYRLHHVTVRGLEPGKDYYYVLGTGSSTFDNDGQAYKITTIAKQSQSPPNNQTVYGNVMLADGKPAEGAIVYVYGDQLGTLSSLVKASGSFGISLANAFSLDKSTYAQLSDESQLEIKVQGIEPNLLSSVKTTIASAQPVADLILGQKADLASTDASASAELEDLNKEELLAETITASDSSDSSAAALALQNNATSAASAQASASGQDSALQGLLGDLSSADSSTFKPEVLDLNTLDQQQASAPAVLTTTQPQIKATLPANTMVRIVIHSDTQIDETMQTDADGNLVLDVANLGKNLEPGEHTASYTYIDPVTGKEVTKTYSFTVDPSATPRQLAQTTSPTTTPVPTASIPYGSGNPYVPTLTTTPSVMPIATTTPTITSGSSIVSTSAGQYSAGSVGTTFSLILMGSFFIMAGLWSYFLAKNMASKKPL